MKRGIQLAAILGVVGLVACSSGNIGPGADGSAGQGGVGQGGVGQGGVGGSSGSGGNQSQGGSAGSSSGASGAAGSGAGMSGMGGASGAGGSESQSGSLSFTSPTEGQLITMDGLPPRARASLAVNASANIARVRYLTSGGVQVAESATPPSFSAELDYQFAGAQKLVARGYSSDGGLLAVSEVGFTIKPPAATACLAELDQLGVEYTPTQARGVVEAVFLTAPLNGVRFASGSGDKLASDPMACEFVKTLWQFADLLKKYGFVKIGGLGSYCYRCLGGWSQENYCRGLNDPEPTCGSSGLSKHSFGRAIDIRYLYKSDGTVYDVKNTTDWVESGETTCGAAHAGQTGKSKELYDLICEAHNQNVFDVALTPNYNAGHRDHFHLDIGESGSGWSSYTKSLPVDDVEQFFAE